MRRDLKLYLITVSLLLSITTGVHALTITTFDPPGSTRTSVGVFGINDAGTIAGGFTDSSGAHGYVRSTDGTFTTFDPPDSIFTFPEEINNPGQIVGSFGLSTSDGFFRDTDGTFTLIDPPDSIFTEAYGINDPGQTVGKFVDSSKVEHGFLRDTDGTFTTFDIPGHITTSSNIRRAEAINNPGQIVGSFRDSKGVVHGFLAIP